MPDTPHEDNPRQDGQQDRSAKARRKKPSEQPSPSPGPLPLWNVLLHHDPDNRLDEVVEHVVSLTHLSKDRAIDRVLQAHRCGKVLLLTTHRERAELYESQFARCNLTVTIQAALAPPAA